MNPSSYLPLPILNCNPEERRAAWRQRCLIRIEQWRRAASPRTCYGYDGGGRHKVRVLCTMDGSNDVGAFRSCEPVHECKEWKERTHARHRHSGWYTGRGGTVFGMVAYVGHGKWLAGYAYSDEDSGGYHLDQFYTSEYDAANQADELARITAEREQEYSARVDAAQAIADKIEEHGQRLAECLALRNDRRECFAGLRAEARACIQAIRLAREELQTDYAGVL